MRSSKCCFILKCEGLAASKLKAELLNLKGEVPQKCRNHHRIGKENDLPNRDRWIKI